jgi:hypothetical protein
MKNKELAELYRTIADGFAKLSEYYSSEDAEQPKAVKKDKPVKAEKKTEPSPVEESATEESTGPVTYTKEEVRAKLAQMSKAEAGKYKADVKGIVAKYSSDGTSPPER